MLLVLLLLSFGGLPPLIGFIPKFLVLYIGALVSVPPLFLIVGRTINLYYYFRIGWSRIISSSIRLVSKESGLFLMLSPYYLFLVMMGMLFIFYELTIYC